MKKLYFVLMAAAMIMLASCRPSTEDVAKKILDNKSLSDAEYKVAMEYSYEALHDIGDSIMKYRDDTAALFNSLQEVNEKYPYGDAMAQVLMSVNPDDLSSETRVLYDKAKAQYNKNFSALSQVVNASSIYADYDRDGESIETAHDSLPSDDFHQAAQDLPAASDDKN